MVLSRTRLRVSRRNTALKLPFLYARKQKLYDTTITANSYLRMISAQNSFQQRF